MFTVEQIRTTLEKSNATHSLILSLQVQTRKGEDKNVDALMFDLGKFTPFYSGVYNNISIVLESFRKIPYGLNRKVHGLTVSQIGDKLNDIGEPWHPTIIATAIQYQLLKMENKFITITDIMSMKFFNLDVRQHEQFYQFR